MILVDHLLAGLTHRYLSLLQMPYLLLYSSPLGAYLCFILIVLEYSLFLSAFGQVDTLDELVFLEVASLEEGVVEDVGLWV